MQTIGKFAIFVLLVLGLSLCTKLQIMVYNTPRNTYEKRFIGKKVYDENTEKEWKGSWRRADSITLNVTLPYKEKGSYDFEDTEASAFEFKGKAGEIIAISLESDLDFFVEIYKKGYKSKAIKSYETGISGIAEINVKEDSDYLLKIQPKLMSYGEYTLNIYKRPQMIFPVLGAGNDAVKSFFGDTRDAGKRTHIGVDIFAEKGTPILSTVNGIAFKGSGKLGGKTVWVHNAIKGISAYYAHLDSQFVEHDKVSIGDTLGTVGNTGNAITTAPHLHFGIYKRGKGPLDPYPFIKKTETSTGKINRLFLYTLVRLKHPSSIDLETQFSVDTSTTFKIMAVTENKVRVRPVGRYKDILISKQNIYPLNHETDIE